MFACSVVGVCIYFIILFFSPFPSSFKDKNCLMSASSVCVALELSHLHNVDAIITVSFDVHLRCLSKIECFCSRRIRDKAIIRAAKETIRYWLKQQQLSFKDWPWTLRQKCFHRSPPESPSQNEMMVFLCERMCVCGWVGGEDVHRTVVSQRQKWRLSPWHYFHQNGCYLALNCNLEFSSNTRYVFNSKSE
jgi:hypothetical protein